MPIYSKCFALTFDKEEIYGAITRINCMGLRCKPEAARAHYLRTDTAMKILIVNYSEDDVRFLERMLEKHGGEVTSATNGLAAFETLQNNRFDLIICDILMPQMDGFQFCRKCKTNKYLRNIPFIFYTTAFTGRRAMEYAMSLGADRLLVKPMPADIFFDAVMSTLNGYKKHLPHPISAFSGKDETEFCLNYNEYLIKKLERQLLDFEEENNRLRENELKFANLASVINDGIVVLNENRCVTHWNPAAEKIFGYSEKEMKGKDILNVIGGAEHTEQEVRFFNNIKAGRIINETIEITGVKKNKSEFPLEASFSTLQIGGHTHIIGLFRDISERRKKDDEKRKKQAILQLINEMFDTAHDLLTVDSTMRLYLKKMCRYLGWPVGHICKVIYTANGAIRLESTRLWYFENTKEFSLLRKIGENTILKPGEDLPGKVFNSREMEWIPDVTKDSNCIRAQHAIVKSADIGVRGTFAFPIKEGDKILYIFEFFSRKEEKPQALFFEVVDNLALQLGRLVERKRADERIRKLSQVVEQSQASILITDKEGIVEYVNPKLAELTGYTGEEIIGRTPRMLKSGKTSHETYRNLWNTIISGKEWQGELLNKKKTGELYWEHVHISPIRNRKGQVTHYLAIKEDVTEHKKFETQLLNMATRDPLTNLFNRRRFQEELQYWIAQTLRYGATGALLFLDLDNFKYVNDTLGHQAGDELLICLAEMLRSRLRDTDIFARFGGDEFAILLPYTDREKAGLIAAEILELTREHTFEHSKVTFSIGIVIFPEHGRDAETLLVNADLAMYRAKESGRNRFCVFSQEQKTHIESQINWEKRIRNALDNDRFVLHLQPVIDLSNKNIIGYEALLRMLGEKDELIFPAEFLSIAERFGLIRDIDRWVVRSAIRLAAERQFSDRGIFLDINLSCKAFADTELLGIIRHQFNTSGTNPGSIVFEMTETAMMENMIAAQDFLAALKHMDCRFSLDDFGSGFSSFNYLKHLAVDYLKIDGSFINDLPNNPVDQHMVKAMVEMAHGLKKRTVAEFADSGDTLKLLRKLGVNYAQGNYIGKPRSVSEVFN